MSELRRAEQTHTRDAPRVRGRYWATGCFLRFSCSSLDF